MNLKITLCFFTHLESVCASIRDFLYFYAQFHSKGDIANRMYIITITDLSIHTFSGAKFSYDYESHAQMKQGSFAESADSRSRHLSLKTSAKLTLTHLWKSRQNETVLKIQVKDNELLSWYGSKSPNPVNLKTQNSLSDPFILVLQSDAAKIYSTASEDEVLNFQRGLASMFIFKQENSETEEIDVLGKCLTKYSMDHHGLHRIKEYCGVSETQKQNVFGNRQYANVKYLYKLQDSGIIDSLEVREWLEFYPHLTPEIAQDIQQRQVLKLTGNY